MTVTAIAELWHMASMLVPGSWWRPGGRRKRFAVWVYDKALVWAIRRGLEC